MCAQKHRRNGRLVIPPHPRPREDPSSRRRGGRERSLRNPKGWRRIANVALHRRRMERKNRRERKVHIMYKKTDSFALGLVAFFPLYTQRFLERPRGEGGDAKRRGVRSREDNHHPLKTNLFPDALSSLKKQAKRTERSTTPRRRHLRPNRHHRFPRPSRRRRFHRHP